MIASVFYWFALVAMKMTLKNFEKLVISRNVSEVSCLVSDFLGRTTALEVKCCLRSDIITATRILQTDSSFTPPLVCTPWDQLQVSL